MRKIALIVALMGIVILLLILNFSTKEIDSNGGVKGLRDNQVIKISGEVIGERESGNFRVLKLDNGLEAYCSCSGYLGKNVSIKGEVEYFNNFRRTRVLGIEEI